MVSAALGACVDDADPNIGGTEDQSGDLVLAPTARHRTRSAFTPDIVVTGNGIDYHGGPVMKGTVHAYYIWYGNWAGNSAKTILADFMSSFGGSPYYNINTTYGDNTGDVANSITLAGQVDDNYSRGTALSDADIQTIVSSHIGGSGFPLDTNGIYFVLTSADVNETSGFCTQYCGWHTNGTISGADVKYSFVGNPDRCITSCADQSTGPNGNAGADGMVSIVAHEFEEAASDPDLNAWWQTSTGMENADKCAWTFGTTYTANGALANMKLGARDFLIQQNWINRNGGSCGLAFGSASPDFSLSATPASQTVVQGSGTTYTVTETPSGGFTGTVNLGASGLPSGATASFSPNPTTGTSTMTVNTSASTPAGTYTLTITGTSGTLSHSTTVTLVVTTAGGGDFSLSLNPSSITVARRQSNSTTVTIARSGGFAGAVTFSISGLPSRTSATFSPNPDSGTTATLTITANRRAVRGTYSFTVTGTSGTLSHTTSGTLTIN